MNDGAGVFADIDENIYHSDRVSLSQSGAKLLLPPSCPAKFRHRMDSGPEHKQVFDFGHLVHKMVLGKGNELAIIDAEDWRSKAAREQRDSAYENGLTPVLISELERAKDMTHEVRCHPTASNIFSQGDPEISLYATDPDTGVRLRGRCDWMTNGNVLDLGDRLLIADYKTAADANPIDLPRAAARFNYALQFAWYVRLAQLLELDESPIFLLIFQEKDAPYLVSVVELDMDAYLHGKTQMAQAIRIYAECTETGVWPGYSDTIQSVSLPPWALRTNQPTIGELLAVE